MKDEAGKIYVVTITTAAREAIREQVRYIAVEQQSPQNASEWLDRVWSCVDGLAFLPLRHLQADGYRHLPYVVRRVVLDNHLILFTVDEDNAVVYVVGLRHGARLPRREELPPAPGEEGT